MDACPTAAFPAPYVLDARRCVSYLTIELKGWIPAELRPLMGNWVYGCDVCQDVCPFNRFAAPTAEAAFRPDTWDTAAPPLLDLLALDEESFARRFAGSPVRRIGRARLVRNACVAAGNWGSAAAVPALVPPAGRRRAHCPRPRRLGAAAHRGGNGPRRPRRRAGHRNRSRRPPRACRRVRKSHAKTQRTPSSKEESSFCALGVLCVFA
ncbi:MAG: hypothetical protein IPH95_10795 [Candidatus Promineofilum sp.]|nr:hypothetical protein [Promineifilum sp.]